MPCQKKLLRLLIPDVSYFSHFWRQAAFRLGFILGLGFSFRLSSPKRCFVTSTALHLPLVTDHCTLAQPSSKILPKFLVHFLGNECRVLIPGCKIGTDRRFKGLIIDHSKICFRSQSFHVLSITPIKRPEPEPSKKSPLTQRLSRSRSCCCCLELMMLHGSTPSQSRCRWRHQPPSASAAAYP